MHEGEEATWKADHGIRLDGQPWRACILAGELVLTRSVGYRRNEELRWPLESLLRPSFADEGLAYKHGAFIPVPRGVLEFQVGRGLVRLEGRPDEMERAFELVSRAARSSLRRTQTARPKPEAFAHVEWFDDAPRSEPEPHPASREGGRQAQA